MAKPAQDIVDELKAQLAALPVGAKRVKVDSLETELSIDEAVKAIAFWQGEAAKATKQRPRIARIDLTGA